MLISTTDISPLHSLLPTVWSRDEDGFGDASGEPGDKLGGTNMFPSPYSVWPKNILQFAEYAGSNIMNPRVTLNTQHFCLNIQSEHSDPDTRHRNQEPFLPFYIMISPCPVSGLIPCLALHCDIVIHRIFQLWSSILSSGFRTPRWMESNT